MAILRTAIATLFCASLLAACDADGGPQRPSFQHFEINNADLVTVHARGKPDATINAAGDLSIAGKPVATTPAQRQLTQRYFTQVQGIRNDAIAVGRQGASLAGKAINEVVGGLIAGDPDRINKRVEVEAGKVEAKAEQICIRLGAIRDVQEALAVELTAFRPYATIRAEQVSDCGDNKRTVRSATLIQAVDDRQIAEVRRLVESGANIDAAVRGDGTALIRAAAHGDLAVVDELIRLGADVNQAARGDGNPLIAAAKHGHADVVARLINSGADVNAVVAGDETPLINAARGGHQDVVAYLVEHGANVNLGVFADFGRWRSPLNQATDAGVRKYLQGKGARAGRDA